MKKVGVIVKNTEKLPIYKLFFSQKISYHLEKIDENSYFYIASLPKKINVRQSGKIISEFKNNGIEFLICENEYKRFFQSDFIFFDSNKLKLSMLSKAFKKLVKKYNILPYDKIVFYIEEADKNSYSVLKSLAHTVCHIDFYTKKNSYSTEIINKLFNEHGILVSITDKKSCLTDAKVIVCYDPTYIINNLDIRHKIILNLSEEPFADSTHTVINGFSTKNCEKIKCIKNNIESACAMLYFYDKTAIIIKSLT